MNLKKPESAFKYFQICLVPVVVLGAAASIWRDKSVYTFFTLAILLISSLTSLCYSEFQKVYKRMVELETIIKENKIHKSTD